MIGSQIMGQEIGITARNAYPISSNGEAQLSHLFRRLQNFSSRIIGDRLDAAVVSQRRFASDQPIWSERGDLSNLFILEQGFAYKFQILPNGQRHIADFFGPGAICNWSRFSAFEEQDDLLFKAQSFVTLLNVEFLTKLFEDQPGLASIFKRHELARAMRNTQRTRALISLSATEKLLIVLLDIFDECAVAGLEMEQIFLPFSQQEVADLLGITPVHVSRTFARLEDDGMIERDNRAIRLVNPEQLRQTLAYRSFFQSRNGR